MKEFIAQNPKQLDLCLKLLYSENLEFIVKVDETEKRKIFYKICVKVEGQMYEELKEKYRILIS
ncbi:hypothetical protein AALC25_00325 [Lachnospiraceae bacterium 29-84]